MALKTKMTVKYWMYRKTRPLTQCQLGAGRGSSLPMNLKEVKKMAGLNVNIL